MGKQSIWSPEAIARMNELPVTHIKPEYTREGAIQAKGIFSESEIPLKDIPPFVEDMAEALVQIKGACSRDVYETFLVAHFEDMLQAIADDDAWLAAGAAWVLANRLQQASAWGKLAGSGIKSTMGGMRGAEILKHDLDHQADLEIQREEREEMAVDYWIRRNQGQTRRAAAIQVARAHGRSEQTTYRRFLKIDPV